MSEFIKIAVLPSEAAADLLEASLRDRGIPHVIKPYHDSALDGLFQLQRGWGHVEASAEYRDEITSILADLGGDATGVAETEPPRNTE